jgi:hypothetical protein
LAGGRDGFGFRIQEIMMLSKKFLTWVGVGMFSVATIPVFAAPILSRQAQRKPAVTKTHTPTKAAATRTLPAKKTLVSKTPVKKTATKTGVKTATRLHTTSHNSIAHRTHLTHSATPAHKTTTVAHKPVALAHKPVTTAHKPLTTAAHKATPTSTAKRLLH